MLDDAEAKVPRIRSSRSPTYGAWVMERDKEKVREQLANNPEEHVQKVWRKNLQHFLRDAKKYQERGILDQLAPVPMEDLALEEELQKS
jgi:hypothetical protein